MIPIAFSVPPPFDYDLCLSRIPGKGKKTMLCFHGMEGDYQWAQILKEVASIDETLITFNFPDHGFRSGKSDPDQTTFGTIHELLPAIYVLKKLIVEDQLNQVNLYGFSAGGGAIINTLAVLNGTRYDPQLKQIGVSQSDKQKILEVVQKGIVILDAPLKSTREIIAFRGLNNEIETISRRYRENRMEPIDALDQLEGLSLHFIIHFQVPDEVLSNRDDDLFIKRVEKYNTKGTQSVVFGHEGGHALPHPALWKYYLQVGS